MDFSRNEVSPLKRYGGIGIVILVHVIVAYVIITSLSGKSVNTEQKPVEVKIIAEAPPPPKIVPPPPPKIVVPPPRQAFIPKVETNIKPPPTPDAIQNKTETKPPPEPKFEPIPDASVPPPKALPSTPPTLGLTKAAIVDLDKCKPDYSNTERSRSAGEEGVVRVQFEIGVEGQLLSAKVVKSSGYPRLDNATLKALSNCKFKPAYQDGKPVPSSLPAEYNWKLDSEG